jgi:hypothetical protein
MVQRIAIDKSPFEHHSFGHETYVDAFKDGFKEARLMYSVCNFCEYRLKDCECKR